MIRLTSKWRLKKGLTPELLHNLESTAERIQSKEIGSLTYLVHLDDLPLERSVDAVMLPVNSTHSDKQTAITFIETYKDANEFSDQLKGELFTNFREENLKYFEEDPMKPGWPVTDSHMLKLDSGSVRHTLCHI